MINWCDWSGGKCDGSSAARLELPAGGEAARHQPVESRVAGGGLMMMVVIKMMAMVIMMMVMVIMMMVMVVIKMMLMMVMNRMMMTSKKQSCRGRSTSYINCSVIETEDSAVKI